jgi:hypothetical protein
MRFSNIILCLFIILLCACKTSNQKKQMLEPEQVLERFLNHLNHLEFEEAKKYATEETIKMLDLLKAMVSLVPEQAPRPGEVVVKKCEISGNKAICNYLLNGKEDTVELMKINNFWLVHLTKESIIDKQ